MLVIVFIAVPQTRPIATGQGQSRASGEEMPDEDEIHNAHTQSVAHKVRRQYLIYDGITGLMINISTSRRRTLLYAYSRCNQSIL